MRARASALAVLALAGCDAVLGIDHVDPRVCPDAGPPACRDTTATTNEDGDAAIDGCDACPQDAGSGTDMDGDGVGDVCDPDPATAGDSIVLFDGFTTDLHYTTTTQSWNHLNGQYKQGLVTDSSSTLAVDATFPAVDAIFSAITAADDHGAGVLLDFGATRVDCAHIHRGNPVTDQLVLRVDGTVAGTIDFAVTTPIRFILRQNRDGSLDCTAKAMAVTVNVHGAALAETTATELGFITFGATAVIDSVTVFGKHDVAPACVP